MTVTGWEKPAYLPKPIEPVFEDVEAVPLFRSPLTEYLAERGIPYAIASRHCCRLNYGVRGKRYFAVGFPNMAGGYEVRSRYFKGCIPPKDMSLVMAKEIPADECLVFEGFMDFLSAVTLGVTGNADCLVLNSVANVEKAAGLLDGYGNRLSGSSRPGQNFHGCGAQGHHPVQYHFHHTGQSAVPGHTGP